MAVPTGLPDRMTNGTYATIAGLLNEWVDRIFKSEQ